MKSLGDAVTAALGSAAREMLQDPDTAAPARPYLRRLEQTAAEIKRDNALREAFQANASALGLSPIMAEQAFGRGVAGVERLWNVSESPIETALAPWLVFQHYGAWSMTIPAGVFLKGDAHLPNSEVVVIPQFEMLGSRFDFAVMLSGRQSLVAVECDGAEFHNSAADELRDARFRMFGIPTVRATGAEIYADPGGVARRIAAALEILRTQGGRP